VRVSQKLEYACRAAICLAKHYDGGTVMKLEDIAQREDISSSFLVQILNELKRAGIVDSRRGKAGGYALNHPPAAITLKDIVEAIEPSLLTTPRDTTGESGVAVATIWDGISRCVLDRLETTSLETIASNANAPMYFI